MLTNVSRVKYGFKVFILFLMIRLSTFVFRAATIYGQVTVYGRCVFQASPSGLGLTLLGDLGSYQTEESTRYRAGAERQSDSRPRITLHPISRIVQVALRRISPPPQ